MQALEQTNNLDVNQLQAVSISFAFSQKKCIELLFKHY